MKKLLTLSILFSLILTFISPVNAANLSERITTDREKPWTITFSDEVDFNSVNEQSIYIETDKGNKHPISFIISDDLKQITVTPKKQYAIGTAYTLVISDAVRSTKGGKLSSAVDLPFRLEGVHIKSVQATLNPFATNVKVQSVKGVDKLTVSVNGTAEQTMHRSSNDQFQRALLGLASGDELILRAYDQTGRLLETLTYEVVN